MNAPTPRQLLAQADNERRIAHGASMIRVQIRLFRKPVIERRSKRWGWWRDESTAPDERIVEVIPADVVDALYRAAGVVEREAEQRARDLEARVTAAGD